MLDMKDVVWEELALQSLVDDDNMPAPLAQSLEKKLVKGRDDAIIKHKKMLSKPGFNVLMDRYQSLPSKPKQIAKSRISELADPVLGRLTHLEKKHFEMQTMANKSEWKESSPKKVILATNSSTKKVNRNQMGSEVESTGSYVDFYQQFQQYLPTNHQISNSNYQTALYEAILEAKEEEEVSKQVAAVEGSPNRRVLQKNDPVAALLDSLKQPPSPQHETTNKIELNIKTSKNNFASLLRDRIQLSQKVDKLTSGLSSLQALDAALANAGDSHPTAASMSGLRKSSHLMKSSKQQQPAVKPSETSSSRLRKLNNQKLANGKQERKSVKAANYIDPQSKGGKGVSSSGYGRLVTRYSHLKQPPPPPPSSQRKKKAATLPVVSSSSKQSTAAINRKKRSTSSTGRVKSVAETSDDDEGGTFLTSLLNNSNEFDPSELQDDVEEQKQMSKFQRKLRASLVPAIPPTIYEKKPSSSATTKSKKMAKLPPMNEKLVSSGSAPAKLPSTSLRQSVKATHRPTKEDMAVKKQVKSQQRLKEMMEDALREETPILPSSQNSQASLLQCVQDAMEDDDDNSLVSVNNYGKKRSMKTNSSIKRANAGEGDSSFQIATMPRAVAAVSKIEQNKPTLEDDLLAKAEKFLQEANEEESEREPQQSEVIEEGTETAEDIFSSISKLKKFEHSVQDKDMYLKADANATLFKHAERLGQHFNNMDSLFKKFSNIKEGLE